MYEMKILILYWPSRISVKAMCNVRTTKKAEITSRPGPFAWVSNNDSYFHQKKNMHATHHFSRGIWKRKSTWTWNIWITSQHQILKTT